MINQRPLMPKVGATITAAWAQQLQDLVVRNSIDVSSCVGLDIRQTPGGTVLAVSTSSVTGQLAITDGAISACVQNTGACLDSGGAAFFQPGTGNVNFVNYNGTCWQENLDGNISVLNFSTTTGGIPDGTLVWLSKDDADNWVITAVDCGN